ncbi:sulfate adenylyltransferase subunit CysD [Pelagibacteraceae bacterium]|nr:sulfate adenylyltransferase subunit CysD [Pelagibacteraceae bacterium]
MKLSHIDKLESESIHIIREVSSEFVNPVMLYSIGKDSSVMLHLAQKAFYPSKIPFKLMHIDTTWKFKEMINFRNDIAKKYNLDLLVHINQEGVLNNINPISSGSKVHTDVMKTQSLIQALDKYKFDAAFGGARRDEEKSRAKERIFSFRDKKHRWDPKNQKPELWNLFNTKIDQGESVRVFPLSNWTEIDIWQYIYQENIPLVPLYFSKIRPIIRRNDMMIMVDDDRLKIKENEKIEQKKVRFRTLGCYPLTAAVESDASTVEEIIIELLESKYSERQGRLIDNDQIGSMEKKKQEGYF